MIRALPYRVYVRAPDFWTPNFEIHMQLLVQTPEILYAWRWVFCTLGTEDPGFRERPIKDLHRAY